MFTFQIPFIFFCNYKNTVIVGDILELEIMSAKRHSLSSIFDDELDYERSGYQAPPSIDVVVIFLLVSSK